MPSLPSSPDAAPSDRLFDRYVVVDWSAAGRPVTGTNSIWIAVVDADRPRLSNPSTRRVAEREIARLHDPTRRSLLAVDASLGYPFGTAAWFGLDRDQCWRSMWRHLSEHLVDDDTNANNRFAVAAALNRRRNADGPFWGRPAGTVAEGLGMRKPVASPLPEFRIVEQRLRAAGRRPASPWQLLGAGSVGGQTLTLLPILHRLLDAGGVEVWPFTTGLTVPAVASGVSVVAEVWPTMFDMDLSTHVVRDAAQVEGVARRLRDADASGDLARWFVPELDPRQRALVEGEEGWTLGPGVSGPDQNGTD